MDDDEAVKLHTETLPSSPELLTSESLQFSSSTSSSSPSTKTCSLDSVDHSVNMNATEASTSSVATTSAMSTMVVDNDFLSTGRTGRRNAMADILDEKIALLTTADLPDQLQSLSFGTSSEPSCSTASTSSCLHSEPSSSGAGPSSQP